MPSIKSPQICESRSEAEYGSDCMQSSPRHEHGPRRWPRVGLCDSLQSVICRHYTEEGIRPVGEDEHRANDPSPIPSDPRRKQTERCRDGSQACLHGIAGVIAWLPLLEQIFVIQRQARRMLGEVDVEGRPRKRGGKNECHLTGKPGASASSPAAQPLAVAQTSLRVGVLTIEAPLRATR